MPRSIPCRAGAGALLLASSTAFADEAVPVVVTDIPPVQSLVSAVMDGIGTPAMLYRRDDSPHGGTLRPSAASTLQSADLAVWTGVALTPPLGRMIDSLQSDIVSLSLLEVAGTTRLRARGDHDHAHDHDDEHVPSTAVDAHAWLDPDNAMLWANTIADVLGELDPQHADGYADNAAMVIDAIQTVSAELDALLAPLRDQPFLVAHDSLQYLEHRFGLTAGDSIAFGDAAAPGPATLNAARQRLLGSEVGCVLAEAGEDSRYVRLVSEGTAARVVTIDPRGVGLESSAADYPMLLATLGRAVADCLAY